MEQKIIRHGNHVSNNNYDGYVYSFNTSKSETFSSHLHACYEFIHIIHGQLVYTVEGNEYILSDGDMIMTNPSELHSFSFPAECEFQREFLHIYPGFVKDFHGLLANLNRRKMGYFNRIPREMVERYEIDKIFKRLEECCGKQSPETDFLALGLSVELLAKISQILRNETPEYQIISKKSSEVCDYIDGHFNDTVTVSDIADRFYISQSQLNRIFKKDTGMTVKTYLNMRRITHAKNLIMYGRQMIKNIYIDCGFDDYSTFYRAFVKYVGMSPEEFKKAHRKKVID